ncbi:adenylyl-sulfate kinase [Limnobacter thiooxidans]|uniref:Adenylyl-sulfate kinase n=1 Tax=Limnobacter thiooxidans TaxID=131080 RepID=A0AA86J126_9BURK|nr:adenylyl-sulfate kinase [Limnobacter thiooxidans]BET24759.1 hypothetical protein RGQ30_02600 [Limnobacter thiooxidans]
MLIDQFEGEIAWKYRQPMIVGRVYKAKAGTKPTLFQCTITELKYLEGQDGTTRLAAKTLLDGQKGVVNLQLEPGFESNLDVVGLPIELLEMDSEESLASCTLHFPLRRSSNIRWQAMSINREARETMMQQKGKCIWFTGLSGSGKSTIASAFEQHLFQQGRFTMTLDGDNVRHGLNKDLGFTETDRVENIRRVAEVSKLMVEAGLVVLVSFISPFRAERKMARDLFAPGDFLEVFVDTPLEECERRDVKGLYAKARRGEIKNFTGIDSAYEPPLEPEIRLPTLELSTEDCCKHLSLLLSKGQA